jgi:MFS family permease
MHPAVLDRRIRDALAIGLAGVLLPVALTLALSVSFPHMSLPLALAIIAGLVAAVALVSSTRLEVTVTLLVIYLLLLSGPVKLETSNREISAAVPDILIAAVCLGALLRTFQRRERVRMPPLSAWVLAFVGMVLIEAFNPKTISIIKMAAGFRQQLQWVPFFFFAYVLMRSKRRFRMLFIILGACAIANGAVATVQSSLSPTALASWGPGYRAVYEPATVEGVTVTNHVSASKRSYSSEGEQHVRPSGLGSDSGFSGGVGMITLPAALALVATWRGWRRWVAIMFAFGAVVGIAMGQGRLQLITGVLTTLTFVGLAALAGRGRRPAVAMLTVIAVTIPLGLGFLTLVRSGTFKRYESIVTTSTGELATHKAGSYTMIPHQLSVAPFGVGLGTVGAVGAFGGYVTNDIEGHTVNAETEYNLIADEVGLPGLALWAALSIYVTVVIARGLRRIRDDDTLILLAGACGSFPALMITGFSGPFTASPATGPYFWFAIGVAAYWFAGHKRLPAPTAHAGPVLASEHAG